MFLPVKLSFMPNILIDKTAVMDLIFDDKEKNIGAKHKEWHSSMRKLFKADPKPMICTFF
jgi:hypothetical protein